MLGDVAGKDVVELGCGTAYVSAWLARRGARATGVDVTEEQLATARRMQAEHGLEFPLIHASAEDVPLPDASFDLAVSEYGASIWCDPDLWIAEAARLLRPGGELVFLVNGTFLMLTSPDVEPVVPAGTELLRPYFGMRRFEWVDDPSVDFHLGYGDWIRVLTSHGFEVERLVELRNPGQRLRAVQPVHPRVGGALAGRGDVEGAEGGVSAPPAPPLLLASTSPQRRAILDQLGLPFDVVAPRLRGARPARRRSGGARPAHAQGKARSVTDEAGDRRFSASTRRSSAAAASTARPRGRGSGGGMLDALGGATHEVVSGLCLLTPGWEELHTETTRVTFRPLDRAGHRRVRRIGRVGGPRRRVRDPGPRRRPGRADRRRLPERRRAPGSALVRLLSSASRLVRRARTGCGLTPEPHAAQGQTEVIPARAEYTGLPWVSSII